MMIRNLVRKRRKRNKDRSEMVMRKLLVVASSASGISARVTDAYHSSHSTTSSCQGQQGGPYSS
jgi:hypothetical protein